MLIKCSFQKYVRVNTWKCSKKGTVVLTSCYFQASRVLAYTLVKINFSDVRIFTLYRHITIINGNIKTNFIQIGAENRISNSICHR